MRSTTLTRRHWASGLSGLALTLAAGFSTTSMAGTVDLSSKPPEASTAVAPNLVLTFDDSGSMTWHYSPDDRPYTGARWNAGDLGRRCFIVNDNNPDDYDTWPCSGAPAPTGYFLDPVSYGGDPDRNQDIASNRVYRPQAGPYLCAAVITPGISDAADPRSWGMNGLYFNPDNDYAPPFTASRVAMPNSSYAKAWDNGIAVNRAISPIAVEDSGRDQNARDLGSTPFCGQVGAGYFKYTGSASTLPMDANGQLTPDAKRDLYTDDHWTWVSLAGATPAEKTNFANWYSYYRTRNMAAVTAISIAYSPFDKNVRVAWQNLNDAANKISNATPIYKFVDDSLSPVVGQKTVRTKFYNWLFAMPAVGGTPNRSAAKQVGVYFTDRTGAVDNNPYWDRDAGKELVCRQNFHIQMTDGMWNGDGGITTPDVDTAAIATLPDGRAFSTSENQSKVVWNEADNSVVTMADIAFYYWSRDLQSGVTTGLFATPANRLKVSPYITDTSTGLFGEALLPGSDPRDNKEVYWNPANDPASWPHLVQYMIGFGASGTLAKNDATYLSLRKGDKAWPVPVLGTDDGKKIDDMWHAALNSRGEFFAASSPSELIAALQKIISGIVGRSATAVAGSLGSSVLSPAAVAYKAGYDTNDWSGTLTANTVDAAGVVSTGNVWNGRDLLDARTSDDRVILTSTGTGAGKGAAFSGTTVINAINGVDSSFGVADGGADRLAWLRGDNSKSGTHFRQRNHLLGAVMNAQTLYVAQPTGGYRNVWPASSAEAQAESDNDGEKGYVKFQATHAKRAPTIYLAANDGMLHAFDASAAGDTYPETVDVAPSPGRERWAYVPYSVYGKLSQWSSLTGFDFQPSVDGTPVSRDVYFSGSGRQGWHTVLVAGLRYGGRGVYALDITEASASESSASSKVLWEFNHTSAGGANLGYTFGRPNIGRLASGQWVVLVPGGYFPKTTPAVNCTASPTNPACNNFSSLFVLNAETGELIKEIKTPTTVNGLAGSVTSFGLSTPVLGDYEGDQIDDVAFAGDLQGNIWRFDLADANSENWGAKLFFRPASPGDRPVTVMPRLFADPIAGGLVVVFGTGKYLAGADNAIDDSTKRQAIYGIRDSGDADQAVVEEGVSALVKQDLTEKSSVRGVTTKPVPAVSYKGWYIELYLADGMTQTNRGERVVVDATALSDTNRVVITTLIPQDNDPCDPVQRGAVMFLDAATGGAAPAVNFGAVTGWPAGYAQAGVLVKNPPTGGFLPVATAVGGGQVYVPGLTIEGGSKAGETPSAGAPIWRRRSWRVLGND